VLLKDPRFYETPYVGKKGWVSMKVKPETLKRWSEVEKLLLESYRTVALERMLKQLT